MIFENEFVQGRFNLFEPQSIYQLDHTYSSIDQFTDLSEWDDSIEGTVPQDNDSDYETDKWYTIEW